jgi:hypothetical protein
MKTALQLLIQSLEEVKKELNTKWDGDPLARRGIVIAINEATNLLEKEKEQIIEAYLTGADYTTYEDIKEAEEYYNQTYNQNK